MPERRSYDPSVEKKTEGDEGGAEEVSRQITEIMNDPVMRVIFAETNEKEKGSEEK